MAADSDVPSDFARFNDVNAVDWEEVWLTWELFRRTILVAFRVVVVVILLASVIAVNHSKSPDETIWLCVPLQV